MYLVSEQVSLPPLVLILSYESRELSSEHWRETDVEGPQYAVRTHKQTSRHIPHVDRHPECTQSGKHQHEDLDEKIDDVARQVDDIFPNPASNLARGEDKRHRFIVLDQEDAYLSVHDDF